MNMAMLVDPFVAGQLATGVGSAVLAVGFLVNRHRNPTRCKHGTQNYTFPQTKTHEPSGVKYTYRACLICGNKQLYNALEFRFLTSDEEEVLHALMGINTPIV